MVRGVARNAAALGLLLRGAKEVCLSRVGLANKIKRYRLDKFELGGRRG